MNAESIASRWPKSPRPAESSHRRCTSISPTKTRSSGRLLSELIQESSGRAKQICDAAPNALARLTALLNFMADELANDPVRVRFMAQFDAMYARDWPAERLICLESQINPDGFRCLQ